MGVGEGSSRPQDAVAATASARWPLGSVQAPDLSAVACVRLRWQRSSAAPCFCWVRGHQRLPVCIVCCPALDAIQIHPQYTAIQIHPPTACGPPLSRQPWTAQRRCAQGLILIPARLACALRPRADAFPKPLTVHDAQHAASLASSADSLAAEFLASALAKVRPPSSYDSRSHSPQTPQTPSPPLAPAGRCVEPDVPL